MYWGVIFTLHSSLDKEKYMNNIIEYVGSVCVMMHGIRTENGSCKYDLIKYLLSLNVNLNKIS